jgi:hypothetical protein
VNDLGRYDQINWLCITDSFNGTFLQYSSSTKSKFAFPDALHFINFHLLHEEIVLDLISFSVASAKISNGSELP